MGPVTGELRGLPKLLLRSHLCWNAAVVCAAHGECDHLVCSGGPFLVVCLDSDAKRMLAYVYSSEAGAWSEPTYGPPSLTYGVEMVPSALVGNAIYFLIDTTYSILKYDLATRNMSVIRLPSGFISDFAVLTTNEDGRLGFARVEDYRLGLWSMETETGPEGEAVWAQYRSIELKPLLPVDASTIVNDYVGFAHGVGVFFVGTEDAWFSIDLKSGQVKEEDYGDGHTHGVVPYASFYTPDLRQYGRAPV